MHFLHSSAIYLPTSYVKNICKLASVTYIENMCFKKIENYNSLTMTITLLWCKLSYHCY